LIVHLQTDPGFPIMVATLLAKKTVPEKPRSDFDLQIDPRIPDQNRSAILICKSIRD